MTRRCSHCTNNGHNSRTCPSRGGGGSGGGGGVKLFGVRLTDGSIIKKSASMGNLSAHYHSSSSAAASPNPSSPSSDPLRDPLHVPDGYLSDDPAAHATSSSNRRAERKKGVPWTEEEHRLFLLGLQKLGKGDWRGISRNFVTSRTPTQVASHAQKYFIRQSNASRRKRRSSLFDMVPEMDTDPPTVPEEQFMLPPSQAVETDTLCSLPSLKLSLNPEFEPMEATCDEKFEEEAEESTIPLGEIRTVVPKSFSADTLYSLPSLKLSLDPEFEPMEATSDEKFEEKAEESTMPLGKIPTVVPKSFSAYLPIPFLQWSSNAAPPEEERAVETSHHQVIRPIPILLKEPVNIDELVGMSQLSLGETETGRIGPSPLSLNLLGEPSRPSAFHASTPVNGSDITERQEQCNPNSLKGGRS